MIVVMQVGKHKQGFTIVELLIVVVVIAILAAITIISYNGIAKRATDTSMQSQLSAAARRLEVEKVTEGAYPNSLADSGISFSSDFTSQFTLTSTTFCITLVSDRYQLVYSVDQEGGVKNTPCIGHTGLAATSTNEACFAFTPGTNTITGYYAKESNVSSNPVCPRAVVIPSAIGGVQVRVIGVEAFRNKSLTSLVIPNTVTTIRGNAFQDNLLTSVTIPNTITSITATSFNNNQLPDSQAFIYKRNSDASIDFATLIGYGGAKRTGIVIPSTVTTIGAYAFNGITNITSVTIPNSVLSIGNNSFSGIGLTSLTIGTSVTSISQYAFAFNQLTTVTIPSSVTVIEQAVFNGNQLPDSQAFLYKRNTNGTIDTSTVIGYGGSKRSGVVVPNTVSTIAAEAFFSAGVSSITIPTSVTSIGSLSFANNYSLTSVSIPSPTYVSSDAFSTSVVITRY